MERYLVELNGDQVELLSGMVREAIKVADEKKVPALEAPLGFGYHELESRRSQGRLSPTSYLPQSSSASRFTAGAAGYLKLQPARRAPAGIAQPHRALFVSPVVAQASSCTMIRLRWISSKSN
jgi:hypothetical protein